MTSHNCRHLILTSLVCFVIDLKSANGNNDGTIVAFNTNSSLKMFCLRYLQQMFQLPSKEDAFAHPLLDLTPWSGCPAGDANFSSVTQESLRGEVVIVEDPNCTLYEKALEIQQLGASGVIIVDSNNIVTGINGSVHVDLNISVAIISRDTFAEIKALGPDVKVIQYANTTSIIDGSLLVVWLISVVCVVFGALWETMIIKSTRYVELKRKRQSNILPQDAVSDQPKAEPEQEPGIVHFKSVTVIVFLVIFMSAMLMLLYFFYGYLVLALNILYGLGAASSYYQLYEPAIKILPGGKIKLKKSILVLCSLFLSITWFCLRKESFIWFLQNYLSMCLIINVLKVLRFPSFRILTFLLTMLFLYDIFFVFITPFFTKNGESIMVEAASGGEGYVGETMPMIFKVPNFSSHSSCGLKFIFLGFGDVLFPGLLVGYCYRFKSSHKTYLYFYLSIIAYSCGLLITFMALFFMSSAQPALLYLVPSMIIPLLIAALIKKEFTSFWTGINPKYSDLEEDDNSTVISQADVPNVLSDNYDSTESTHIEEANAIR